MAGFEIGGNGNEYDRYYTETKGKTGAPKKKLKLTPEQLSEALKKAKLRPAKNNTKYGINTPVKPEVKPETHTKYGLNCSMPGTTIQDSGTPQTKYGINFNPGPQTKYGLNTPNK